MNAPPAPDFLDDLDLDALVRDLDELRNRVGAELDEEDAAHLAKIERWSRLSTALGYATAWIAPNPIAIGLISLGRVSRWTMVAHHVSHRGYDKVPSAPPTRTSKTFARGWRRWIDWADWIAPADWDTEHNQLHHYRLGEEADPDLVERNLRHLRASTLPRWAKKAIVAGLAATWKPAYYAPNAFLERRNLEARRAGEPEPYPDFYDAFRSRELWTESLLPYALGTFVAMPALFTPLGPVAVLNVAINSFAAELLTNLHGFLVIVTNHAGDDLYRFEGPTRSRGDFYLRQILGSVNFRTGGDLNDFLHGFLNYQIEHHLFPHLPMRKLQQVQPEVKRICEKHGVPYVQESVFRRLQKTVAVMIGDASMRHDARLDRAPKGQAHETPATTEAAPSAA